jgi:hypothetical protein
MTNAHLPAWDTLTNRWYKVNFSRQGAKNAKDLLSVGVALAANSCTILRAIRGESRSYIQLKNNFASLAPWREHKFVCL